VWSGIFFLVLDRVVHGDRALLWVGLSFLLFALIDVANGGLEQRRTRASSAIRRSGCGSLCSQPRCRAP